MVGIVLMHWSDAVKLRPVHPGLSVVRSRGRNCGLEDVVGLDVVVGVEEAHADVLLLVISSILVTLQLQRQAAHLKKRMRCPSFVQHQPTCSPPAAKSGSTVGSLEWFCCLVFAF